MSATTEDHLTLLKRMRHRIQEAVFDDDCPPRDLASLTRRLQDISREIEAIEERQRLEGGNRNGSASTAKATPGAFNPDNA